MNKSLSEKRKEIIQFAEIDDFRWKELMLNVEKQDKEFIRALENKLCEIISPYNRNGMLCEIEKLAGYQNEM